MINKASNWILSILVLALCAISSAAQTAQATPPPPTAPHLTVFPKPVEKNLPNGLRVIVIPRTEMPLVTAQLLIKSGGGDGPTHLSRAPAITGSPLARGPRPKNAPPKP